MKVDKLKRIVEHNKFREEDIARACYMFYWHIGRSVPTVILDIQVMAEAIFADTGYRLVHIPLENDEVGAFLLRFNEMKYLMLNTAKNIAYNNYSVAHELYHILIQDEYSISLDIFKEEYSDNENELMANAFAGNILMPKEDFILTSDLLRKKIHSIKRDDAPEYFEEYLLVSLLMNYFKTTYMSVVVRCFELHIFDMDNSELVSTLLSKNDKEQLSVFCNQYALYVEESSIAQKSMTDDFEKLLVDAKLKGEEKIKQGILNREELEYKLEGMKKAYMEVVKKQ